MRERFDDDNDVNDDGDKDDVVHDDNDDKRNNPIHVLPMTTRIRTTHSLWITHNGHTDPCIEP